MVCALYHILAPKRKWMSLKVCIIPKYYLSNTWCQNANKRKHQTPNVVPYILKKRSHFLDTLINQQTGLQGGRKRNVSSCLLNFIFIWQQNILCWTPEKIYCLLYIINYILVCQNGQLLNESSISMAVNSLYCPHSWDIRLSFMRGKRMAQ